MQLNLQNLGEFVFLHPDADKVAIIHGGQQWLSWTFKDFRDASSAFARGLLASGVAKQGGRLGILSENSAEYLIAFSGAMLAGLTAVPISYRLAPQALTYILDDAQCSAICVDDPARMPAGRTERLILLNGTENGSFADMIAMGATSDELLPVDSDSTETACILYTSGTTGRAKGVMLTHAGQIWALQHTSLPFADMADSITLMAAPYYHMNGLFISMNCLASGVGLAIMPRFDAREYLRLLAKLRCPFLTGIPAMFAMLARESDLIPSSGFRFVKHLIVGSSPLSSKQLDIIRRIFPEATIRNAFGTTEGGAYVFGPHPKQIPTPEGSLGYPAADVEIALIGGADDNTGSMHMRSPAVMSGYLNQSELTAKKLNQRWYDTGDVMRRDANGFYYHVGRLDDMFVCGGENIYPGDIEDLLERHDAVAQVAVVPIPDQIKNFVPIAFVVRSEGSIISEKDIKAYAIANAPAFAHPRHVIFLEAMPIAATFKYDRAALLAQAQALFGDGEATNAAHFNERSRSGTSV